METAAVIISAVIFAVLARFADKSAYVLCCFIKGAALILISNWILAFAGLGSISLNLFTAPVCGILGVPAVALFWSLSIFF